MEKNLRNHDIKLSAIQTIKRNALNRCRHVRRISDEHLQNVAINWNPTGTQKGVD